MNKLLSLLFVLGLALSACRTEQTQSAPPAQTSTLASTSTNTITSTATQTPIPPTATVTPLPTIPTITPTFDVSTIITVTPAEKAECPSESSKVFSENLSKELESWDAPKFIDLTNDGVEEIIIDGHRYEDGTGTIFIYSCLGRKYTVIHMIRSLEYPSPQIEIVKDLNKNGLPEVVVTIRYCGGFGSCWGVHVLEWDGTQFIDLLDTEANEDSAPWLKAVKFRDVGDNTTEIIIEKGLPNHPDSLLHGPWREFTDIYSWNGNKYARKALIIAKPQFLFQAVQDGDYQSDIGNYDKAILIYQKVISKGDLDWWSEERYLAQLQTDVWGYYPTPTPSAPDPTEYPRLAAYAYYRIMLLHFVQGQEAEAASTYQTLQETFGDDPYAAPYVEMASAFWEAYQSTRKMYDGCAAAIQYTVEHPEILIPLGSDYHGWQSHIYEPADVCPFR